MMRYGTLLSLSIMAVPLCADWKVTTVSTSDSGDRSIETQYFKNGFERTDNIDPASGQLRSVLVLDYSGKRSLTWDLERREYSIQRPHAWLSAHEATRTFVIDVESTDTGERRSVFGRQERRVITIERRYMEGAPPESESRTDGWYFESDSLPPGIRTRNAALFTVADAHAPLPALKINQHGLIEKGLPVSTTTTTIHMQSGRNWQSSSEVTELFEGHLVPAVFEPPPGFRRVFHFDPPIAMSWQDQLLMRWEWFQDWFAGLRH